MLRENNSLASLCWLQGNLVRKKSKEKEQQNRCKHRQGRRNCKLIHPPTKVISIFFSILPQPTSGLLEQKDADIGLKCQIRLVPSPFTEPRIFRHVGTNIKQ